MTIFLFLFKGKRQRQHKVEWKGFILSLCQRLSLSPITLTSGFCQNLGVCVIRSFCGFPLWLYFTEELASIEDRLKKILKATKIVILRKKIMLRS